jgi:hypothetical protein
LGALDVAWSMQIAFFQHQAGPWETVCLLLSIRLSANYTWVWVWQMIFFSKIRVQLVSSTFP